MTDKEVLEWLYDRMVNVHGEKKNYDYMIRFKSIIDRVIVEGAVTWKVEQNQ